MLALYSLHSILILRLYGLYGSAKLAYFLLSLLCLACAAEIYVLLTDASNYIEVDVGFGIGNTCVLDGPVKLSFVW